MNRVLGWQNPWSIVCDEVHLRTYYLRKTLSSISLPHFFFFLSNNYSIQLRSTPGELQSYSHTFSWMERDGCFKANTPGKHKGNTGSTMALPTPCSALCTRFEQRTKLITVHSTGPRYYACYYKTNDSTTNIIIFGPLPSRPAITDIISKRDIFL